jgi:Kef-type K+ transport system membrane component KefB
MTGWYPVAGSLVGTERVGMSAEGKPHIMSIRRGAGAIGSTRSWVGRREGCARVALRSLRWERLIVCVALPRVAWAAHGDGQGGFGPLLFALGVLVVVAKVGGLLAERWRQPPVLGELLVGVVLGNVLPLVLGGHAPDVVRADPALLFLAEVGVLILLFDVGLEADVRALVRVGPSAFLVAVIGVVVPIVLGWAVAAWLFPASHSLVHLFIGATLSATSVGITARVLKDLQVTQRPESQVILGAAIVDDVLGLVVLAVVVGMVSAATESGASPSIVAVGGMTLRAVLFLVLAVGLGQFLTGPLIRLAGRSGHPEIMLVIGLGLCFTLAFAAELVGLADIIGAFAAGLMLDPYGMGIRAREDHATLAELLHPLSSLFVPLFFVVMGARVQLGSLASPLALGFGVALTICALLSKLACAAGVIGRHIDRLTVAIGMMPRGEVGLIFAGIGTRITLESAPILSESQFSAIVMMVLASTLVAPIGLRWAFQRRRRGT